jgi:hypothetical protein
MLVVSVSLVMVQMVGILSPVVLSLLDVLHLVINTSLGEVTVLSLRSATDHAFLFVVVVPLQWDRSGLPMVVPGFIGMTEWIVFLIGAVG